MPLMKRFGSFAASESRRVNVTAVEGSAAAFFVMNSRPVEVAAHSVPVSEGARAMRASVPPARSPYSANTVFAGARVESCMNGGASKASPPTNSATTDSVRTLKPLASSETSIPLACQKRVSGLTY